MENHTATTKPFAPSTFRQIVEPDVIVISNDNVESKAHKIILCQISPYFVYRFIPESTITVSSKEMSRLKWNFKDEIVQQVLDYAYNGKCSITKSNLDEMLQVADLYNIMGLIQLCQDKMWQLLNQANCAQYFLLANTYSVSNIKAIQQYVCHTFKLNNQEMSNYDNLVEYCKIIVNSNEAN